ncbi:MAG: RNA 2',3'-cyclic phosphodiesterase [Xenococcaceae cyanobacterium MO_207.B15]|nr:RNA 2',3'-cyclic phosphodiesterase [Xenococcaceae cyanobacterium MO_207.B15]MDJ0742443.1 RNA 2',3'-cyclic phosphodiesterase [Xenococcaceae cyanobacterium MO_167.B27]
MSNLLRLFVGIFPSQLTRELLNKEAENWCSRLQTEVRLLAPELLHLTVKFIGNVDETSLSNITTAFLKATGNLPSASLQIKQFMLFPSNRKPRVVAAEIECSPELHYIFQFFAQGFSDLGIVAEQGSFHPHITVARARRWQKETISNGTFQLVEPITSVALVHSQLTSEGAKYTVLESVLLN